MSPRVSVVVTVYDRIDFLADALASVLAQTFADYEILVADDSGTGAAESLCRSMNDRRIRCVRNSSRLGVALSLRAAIEEARGTYIAILNDDDVWEPEFLSQLVAPLEADGSVVVAFCDHWIMDESGTVDRAASDRNSLRYGRTNLPGGKIVRPSRLVVEKHIVPLAMGSVFRKSALDTTLLVSETAGAYDYWIACLLAGSGRPFFYVPDRLTRYRVHRRMETARQAPDKSRCLVFIFRTLLGRRMFPELTAHLRQRLARAMFAVARDRVRFGWMKWA